MYTEIAEKLTCFGGDETSDLDQAIAYSAFNRFTSFKQILVHMLTGVFQQHPWSGRRYSVQHSVRNKMIGQGVNVFVWLVQISFLLAVSLVSARGTSAQTALQLFHEMQLALGGAQKISAIRDFDETVRAETWDRQGRPLGTVRKRVRWIRPNYLRIDQSGSYDTYVMFFDGRAGWEIMPDKSVRDLSGGELTFAQNYLHGLDFNVWLADRDPSTIFSSTAPTSLSLRLEVTNPMPLRSQSIPSPTCPLNRGALRTLIRVVRCLLTRSQMNGKSSTE